MHKMQAFAFLARLSEEITTTVTIGRWEHGVVVTAVAAGIERRGYGYTLLEAIESLQNAYLANR